MLELKIFSPQENGFVPEIKWNNEELKAAIAEKMKEYSCAWSHVIDLKKK